MDLLLTGRFMEAAEAGRAERLAHWKVSVTVDILPALKGGDSRLSQHPALLDSSLCQPVRKPLLG